jgi:hypothetical protein
MVAFVKDTSGVIINTDEAQYQAILNARQAQKDAAELQSRLAKLESVVQDLSEIKTLLQQVLSGNKNV